MLGVVMEDNIKLGGNIELSGFKDVDKAQMFVLRKMVGNYAKTMSEKKTDFKDLKVSLTKEGDNLNLKAEMNADKAYTAEESSNNLFVALDLALRKIVDQL